MVEEKNKSKDGGGMKAKMVEDQRQRWMRNKDKDGGRTKAKMVEEKHRSKDGG